MAWASVHGGRAFSRRLLYPIITYFFLTAARPRSEVRAFLRRALGREPGVPEIFRTFLNFATTIHDRVYLLKGRFDLFEIELHGVDQLDTGGTLLMGAHLGSFEAMRACGRGMAGRRVAMAMYEDNARRLNEILATIEPAAMQDIIPLGRLDSMLELESRLAAGDIVGVLADRSLGDEPVLRLPFLGEEASFPTGPMRMAAALRRRVFFMAGIYRGGNRYEITFEPLADFTDLQGDDRLARRERVEAAVRSYAARLERFSRDAPDNWFNFHDFWRKAP
jgi:predicted LPLAT superfamily acyltransferase